MTAELAPGVSVVSYPGVATMTVAMVRGWMGETTSVVMGVGSVVGMLLFVVCSIIVIVSVTGVVGVSGMV